MSHLAYHLDKTSYKIGAVDVFVSFVENDKLIERLPFVPHISKELQQNNEETERLIFFNEFVPEINNHKSPRTHYISETCVIVNVSGCETQSLVRQILEVLGEA